MPKTKKTTHINIPLIVGIVGVLIVVVAWLQTRSAMKSLPIVEKESAPAISSRIENFSDKNIYTNNTYTFSVEYPKEFKLEEFASKYDDTFSISIHNLNGLIGPNQVQPDGMEVSIAVGGETFKRNDFYYGGYEWTKSILKLLSEAPNGTTKDHEYDSITKVSDVTVGEFVGVKYNSVPKGNSGAEGFMTTNVALMHNGRSFHIMGRTTNEKLIITEQYNEIFDSIVASLKVNIE